MKLVVVTFPLSICMYHQGAKAKPFWLGVRMMCPNGTEYQPVSWRFTEITIQNYKRVVLGQKNIILSSKDNFFSPMPTHWQMAGYIECLLFFPRPF
jgi:hypothetical protein